MRVRASVFVGILFLASLGGGVTLSDPVGAQSAEDTTIDLAQTLHLTPDRPGEIEVTQSFDLPEGVTRLRTQLPDDATVVETNGFRHDSGQEYVWTEDDRTPSLRYRVPANVTAERSGPIAGRGEYLFVDVGEWALVRRPLTTVNWAWRGEGEITISRSLETAGPGAAGEEMAFLGQHRVVTHAADEQTFRLVVPVAADLETSAADVFDSLGHASRTLRVGERDATVFMIAAPTGRIGWGVRGIQTGSSDLWVRDEETLAISDNVWVHEYVHTRQEYGTTAAVDWVTEASATYYAALLALERGVIDYGAFGNRPALGTREPQASAVLAQPQTGYNTRSITRGRWWSARSTASSGSRRTAPAPSSGSSPR